MKCTSHGCGVHRVSMVVYCYLVSIMVVLLMVNVNGAPINETFFAPSQCDTSTRTVLTCLISLIPST
jgi:hypothetical protein